jgi:hypothetical protein
LNRRIRDYSRVLVGDGALDVACNLLRKCRQAKEQDADNRDN